MNDEQTRDARRERTQKGGWAKKLQDASDLFDAVLAKGGVHRRPSPLCWVFPDRWRGNKFYLENAELEAIAATSAASREGLMRSDVWGLTWRDFSRVEMRGDLPYLLTMEVAAHEAYHTLELRGVMLDIDPLPTGCTTGAETFGQKARERIVATGCTPRFCVPDIGQTAVQWRAEVARKAALRGAELSRKGVGVLERPRSVTSRGEYERKSVPLVDFKVAGVGAGSFSGYGSVFGNIDSAGDIVAPGAFRNTLPRFLKAGFIAQAHDWTVAIAVPKVAREDSRGLYIEADFHSTALAQDVRTIAAERVAAGKSVGLSIGYEVVDAERNSNGVRVLKELRLFEVSIVTVPANSAATVTTVKGLDLSPTQRLAISIEVERSRMLLRETAQLLRSA